MNLRRKNFSDVLRKQANKKNQVNCDKIVEELNSASLDGEYIKTTQLKVNQVHYLETKGLKIASIEGKYGFYEISWKNE